MTQPTKQLIASEYFSELGIGARFRLNGNDYTKQSTRTGKLLANGRVFYIGAADRCWGWFGSVERG